jgi:hypothetical protein
LCISLRSVHNGVLESLDLSNNDISDEGAESIMAVADAIRCLRYINLDGNPRISTRVIKLIQRKLEKKEVELGVGI